MRQMLNDPTKRFPVLIRDKSDIKSEVKSETISWLTHDNDEWM